jgi:hypothetical protein
VMSLSPSDHPAVVLADAIESALPAWVEQSVRRVLRAWAGQAGPEPDPEVMATAADAGRRAATEVIPELRDLLAVEVEEATTTPLALLRDRAVRYPTEVLRAAGVPPVERDQFRERAFPDDDYDLAPASLSDIAPHLTDLGLKWGAWRARKYLDRHQVPR